MNLNMIDLKISRLAKWVRCFPVLLAVLMLSGRASGQPVTEPPQRWLLIFDTSITMQRWLPGTTTELQNLFYGSMSEQLRAGDSVGVWVFDEKLHTDLCLPFTWQPAKAADEASQLKDFLTQQHYFGSTKFSVLGPVLQRVIAGSQRLTIVLFCDGKDELKLTPYDDSINGTFRAMQADRKKAKDPFILVVRTQLGKFVGATVNLPPAAWIFRCSRRCRCRTNQFRRIPRSRPRRRSRPRSSLRRRWSLWARKSSPIRTTSKKPPGLSRNNSVQPQADDRHRSQINTDKNRSKNCFSRYLKRHQLVPGFAFLICLPIRDYQCPSVVNVSASIAWLRLRWKTSFP